MAEKFNSNNAYPQHAAAQTDAELAPADPSLLTGNAGISDEEEQQYQQKVKYLEGVLEEQTDQQVADLEGKLTSSIGGYREAQRVNIWVGVRKQVATEAYRKASSYISRHAGDWNKLAAEKDAFDSVLSQIAGDMRGTLDEDTVRRGPDATGFVAGAELDSLVGEEELNSPAALEKAMGTIYLLVNRGLYKFGEWGNSAQLRNALQLMQTYTEYVPGFDPKQAGFSETQHHLSVMLAALRADNSTKANYKYAMPERAELITQCEAGLASLRITEAHLYLRYRDFEVPAQTAEPTATEA